MTKAASLACGGGGGFMSLPGARYPWVPVRGSLGAQSLGTGPGSSKLSWASATPCPILPQQDTEQGEFSLPALPRPCPTPLCSRASGEASGQRRWGDTELGISVWPAPDTPTSSVRTMTVSCFWSDFGFLQLPPARSVCGRWMGAVTVSPKLSRDLILAPAAGAPWLPDGMELPASHQPPSI